MSYTTVMSKLTVQGVVGAKVHGSKMISCTSAPTSLTIPAGICEIASYCFSGQDRLTEIYLVNDVRVVGKACFANCPKLTRIICNPCLKKYDAELRSGNHAAVVYREG